MDLRDYIIDEEYIVHNSPYSFNGETVIVKEIDKPEGFLGCKRKYGKESLISNGLWALRPEELKEK